MEPEHYEDIRVVPLPVGFVAGSFLTLYVIAIVSRRAGKAPPNSTVPAV